MRNNRASNSILVEVIHLGCAKIHIILITDLQTITNILCTYNYKFIYM